MSETGWLVVGNLAILGILAAVCIEEHSPWPLLFMLFIHFSKSKPASEGNGDQSNPQETGSNE